MRADDLLPIVRDHTTINAEYRMHAAPESMSVSLDDWKAARDRLDRQIVDLEGMLSDRLAGKAAGEWPPPKKPTDNWQPSGPPVRDLADDLERSLRTHKDRQTGDE